MFGKTIDFPVCSLKLSLSTKPTEHFGENPVGLALTGIFCDMVWWELWDLVKETKLVSLVFGPNWYLEFSWRTFPTKMTQ